MLYQVHITSFIVIIYSFISDISTVIHGNLKIRKELVSKHINQPIQNPSQTSDRNLKVELSLAQSIQVLSEPSVILRVYTGSVTKLECRLNPRPIGKNTVMWFYSPTNLSLSALQEDETIINEWNLTIYNTGRRHAGVYRCATDRRRGGAVLLEVVDDEKYNVVKPPSSNGPYASKPVLLDSQLIMFSAWSEWSECSRCGLVGRRRRYGVCYVALIDKIQSTSAETKQNASVGKEFIKLFHTFPGGIPCRSQLLPPAIRNIGAVQTKKNEIMIALCKVKCTESILKIRFKSGDVIETVNDTAGTPSSSRNRPPRPPPPARSIAHVDPGRRVVITCTGTTLRDMPFTWRVDTREVSPRELDEKSHGRVHLDARDRIVFSAVLYSDAHVYSCWQGGTLAGVVKLQVRRGARAAYRDRLAVVVAVIIVTVLLRLTMRLVRYRRQYLGIA